MPIAIRKGSISFGPVTIPVQIYSVDVEPMLATYNVVGHLER